MFIGAFLLIICFAGLAYALVRFRRGLATERESQTPRPLLTPDGLAFAAFQQTIADLKERQQELETKLRSETDRANASEAIGRALLENLSTPAVVFNRVGLVKQANPAARELFGYASPVGLSLNNLFDRASFVLPPTDEAPPVAVPEVLRDAFRGSSPLRDLRIAYVGRTAARMVLDLTVVPQDGGGVVLLTPVPADGACTDEVHPIAEKPSNSTIEER